MIELKSQEEEIIIKNFHKLDKYMRRQLLIILEWDIDAKEWCDKYAEKYEKLYNTNKYNSYQKLVKDLFFK